MKIIEEFIKANQNNFELASPKVTKFSLVGIEQLTGVRLTDEMKNFIVQLSSLKFKSDDNKVNTTCTPYVYEIAIKKVHKANGGEGMFGFPASDIECIGTPILELNNVDDYSSYLDNFRGFDVSLDGVEADVLDIYPCFLFDIYNDGHVLIGIDYKGRVVSFNYELDEDDCTILANSQEEFINNLFISNEATEI